jgi:glycosyltransferase involved in cell wall biosynthesis
MRIAFAGLAPGADPLRVGGQQSILRRLANYLQEHGHKVDFYVLDSMASAPATPPEWSIQRFTRLPQLLSALQGQTYDYVQFSRVPLKWYPSLIAELRRVTARRGYLYLVHLPNPVTRWARRVLFRLAFDQVFVVSPRLGTELARLGKPVHLLWPPVPVAFFEAGAQREPASEEVRVAYVGRIAADKGVAQVASAFEHVCRRHAHVHAEICGYVDGSSAASHRLHEELQSRSDRTIRYTVADTSRPAMPPREDDVLEILCRSDIVVLPYRSLDRVTIDVPLLLLEAMAAGCVVVSTPIGDIPTILDDPALVSRPAELYAKLDDLIASGHLRARGKSLRQRALGLGVDLESVANSFLEHVQMPIAGR